MLAAVAVLAAAAVSAAPAAPYVYTDHPYTGPTVPIGDWADQSITGNGKGFARLVEPPAVTPCYDNPTNNINVVSLAYLPDGVAVHFQTPFGIGGEPCVNWGTDPKNLWQNTKGYTRSYDRQPPCSALPVTQCSEFFHEVKLDGLKPGKTYYYQIPGGNGTSQSDVLSFTTAAAAGDKGSYSVAILNDMGYTNAGGTYKQILNSIKEDNVAFAWHGGDISYADDWYSGILPCELTGPDSWPICSNGSSTILPNSPPLPIPDEYKNTPLPAGEIPNQGGPLGGDMSVIYESNWDLWQQWMNNITTQVPYMVLPGNHEASCAEFDGPGNVLTGYLNDNEPNTTVAKSGLTYYSCPPSQRNFTAYSFRFRMPGKETGGVSNFWYSFDYGLAHYISFSGETDFYQSPEFPFVADLTGNETQPLENQTFPTDSGPFGYINGSYKDNKAYEQYNWLQHDLASVDRKKTPWVIAMSHRPMYSSETSSYQAHLRNAFEALFLQYGVDAYLSGHIHWYERMWPMGFNNTIDHSAVINNNTYKTNEGKSMVHLVNGMAGNIESHSTILANETLPLTAVLNQYSYGFNKLTVVNESMLTFEYIKGEDGSVGDKLTLLKA